MSNPAKYKMPFGQHKGKTLDEIPLNDLDWLIGQDWLKEPTKSKIKEYLSDPVIAQLLEEENYG